MKTTKVAWIDVMGSPFVELDVVISRRVLVDGATLVRMAETLQDAGLLADEDEDEHVRAILSIPADAQGLHDVTDVGGGFDLWVERILEVDEPSSPADTDEPLVGDDNRREAAAVNTRCVECGHVAMDMAADCWCCERAVLLVETEAAVEAAAVAQEDVDARAAEETFWGAVRDLNDKADAQGHQPWIAEGGRRCDIVVDGKACNLLAEEHPAWVAFVAGLQDGEEAGDGPIDFGPAFDPDGSPTAITILIFGLPR